MPIATIEEAIEDLRQGRMIVLMDDKNRENEGDLCMAAEKVTPEAINFMARFGRGLICLPMIEETVEQLGLTMMVSDNTSPFGTAFTVTIDGVENVTTGISASDRAVTILAATAVDAKPQDLVTPGHIFPLQAKKGGVLVRAGQTEGSVDLARLAGLKPAGVICEVMKDDGTMARLPELLKDYSQDQALKSVAGINERILKNLSVGPKEWDYFSLNVGKFPQGKLNRIKEALRLPQYARGLIIDAGYSVRVLMTGDPVGERLMDINFPEVPSLDYWVKGELVEERLFSNFEDVLRKLRPVLNRYLSQPVLS